MKKPAKKSSSGEKKKPARGVGVSGGGRAEPDLIDLAEARAKGVSAGRAQFAAAKLIVVKVGTAVLTGGTKELDRAWMHDLAAELSAMVRAGKRVILVSSGAIGTGVGVLGLAKRPTDVPALQAAAAAGQPKLMNLWGEAFGVRGVPVAQILLSRADFDSRERFLNIRNCITTLHELGGVPIVNENDTVATEEISLGDNDVLAAKIAVAAKAEALVIITGVGGVMDADGTIIPEVDRAEELMRFIRAEMSGQGRGGMRTKVEAARIATASGVVTIIAPGRTRDQAGGLLRRLEDGEAIGTCVGVGPGKAGAAGKRGWIGLAATPTGAVDVDEGAAKALRERGASLLAKGVVGVTGRFEVGDVIQIRDLGGREVARGLTNLSADELRAVSGKDSREFEKLLGRRVHEEVVHRDNLAVTK